MTFKIGDKARIKSVPEVRDDVRGMEVTIESAALMHAEACRDGQMHVSVLYARWAGCLGHLVSSARFPLSPARCSWLPAYLLEKPDKPGDWHALERATGWRPGKTTRKKVKEKA